jgi:hypothetical protein
LININIFLLSVSLNYEPNPSQKFGCGLIVLLGPGEISDFELDDGYSDCQNNVPIAGGANRG